MQQVLLDHSLVSESGLLAVQRRRHLKTQLFQLLCSTSQVQVDYSAVVSILKLCNLEPLKSFDPLQPEFLCGLSCNWFEQCANNTDYAAKTPL